MRFILVLLLTSTASADIALPASALNLTTTAEVDASANKMGDTVAIAPDVSIGVTRNLTLSVVTSRFAVTGFRAAAGGGFCVTDACASTFRNVGAEAMIEVVRGPFELAPLVGIHALDIDAGFYGAKVGVRAKLTHGSFSAQLSPSVIVALDDRHAMPRNRDTLWAPLGLAYKVSPVTFGIGTGVKAIADDLGETWAVPVGASLQFAASKDLAIGTSFVFGNVVGGADTAGFDARGIQLWVSNTHLDK